MAQRVIRWARKALDDIDDACDYVGQNGPDSSSVLAERIEYLINGILDNPHIGRKIPEYNREDLRERISNHFRILYRLTPEHIEIVGIFYDRRLLPGEI